MMVRSRMLAFAAFSVALATAALAQTPNLDVKMGLWEITSLTQMGGQMPAMDMSKFTPEQRAQMEAAMKGMMGPHQNVSKTCMTREKFNSSNLMFNDRNEEGTQCKQTITNNSRSVLDGSVTCTGEHPATGQIHFEAQSSSAIKGSIKFVTTEQGRSMTVDMAMTGKWLGAECGAVK